MKLKYFLRGLGSGVVITAIILTVSFQGRNSDISDKEIMKRAEALGMVSKEEVDLLAKNSTEEEKPTVTEAESQITEGAKAEEETAENTNEGENTVTEEAEPTVAEETEEPTKEPTATKEPTKEPTATKEPTKEPTATPEPTKEPTATPEPTKAEEPAVEPTQPVTEKKVITIVSGMWSDKVARELEAMGAVEDAADFDQYLIANGYANRIVVGTFEIPAGATYEQIARIITTR